MEKKSENTCMIERKGKKSNKERLATRELVNALKEDYKIWKQCLQP